MPISLEILSSDILKNALKFDICGSPIIRFHRFQRNGNVQDIRCLSACQSNLVPTESHRRRRYLRSPSMAPDRAIHTQGST